MDKIIDLNSYQLFSEISNSLLVISGMIKESGEEMIINELFSIQKNTNRIKLLDSSDDAFDRIIKWINYQIEEILSKIGSCINLTNENYNSFKDENSYIKRDVIERIKDLNSIKTKLSKIYLDRPTYEDFLTLRNKLTLESDIAGIIVKETKNYLI